MSSDIIIKDRLSGVYFSYYTKQEIRKLSVKEINNINAFDQINRPLKGNPNYNRSWRDSSFKERKISNIKNLSIKYLNYMIIKIFYMLKLE